MERSSRLDPRGVGINPPVTTVRIDKGETGIDEGLYSANGKGGRRLIQSAEHTHLRCDGRYDCLAMISTGFAR